MGINLVGKIIEGRSTHVQWRVNDRCPLAVTRDEEAGLRVYESPCCSRLSFEMLDKFTELHATESGPIAWQNSVLNTSANRKFVVRWDLTVVQIKELFDGFYN